MRKALAEFIGTALLLVAVIDSGSAAQPLSPNKQERTQGVRVG